MLPDELKRAVESILGEKTGFGVKVIGSKSVGGGCINETCLVETTAGKYFIKYNSALAFPGMFENEALGLKVLSESNAIRVPGVKGYGEAGNLTFLLLEYIEPGSPGRNFWSDFGTRLTCLHHNSNEFFGLDQDNYIGSLEQRNKPHPDFNSFFILERIEPQLKLARNKGFFSQSDVHFFEALFTSLHNIIPIEKPSLLHGDLWSGNFMVTAEGSACLIDPAVYYGHREADIAMTMLFGGFRFEFYHAYNQAWPMQKGWQERMDIFNLYPLLVHVNLFGGGYAGQVLRIIRQF